MLTDEK
jgi:ATP-binding cassette subfamily B (MDR/TAP) protein 7